MSMRNAKRFSISEADRQKEGAGGTGSSLLFLSNQKAEGYHWGWALTLAYFGRN